MGTTYQTELASMARGVEVSESHFGVNSIATANFPAPGGPFGEFFEATGATHLRYPGGTISEEKIDPRSQDWRDMLDPRNTGFTELDNGERIQTLAGMLEFADQTDSDVTFVFPTSQFLSDGAVGERTPNSAAINRAVNDFVNSLRNNPDSAHLKTIEIGNEYYYEGRMTAEEYASLVNAIVPRLDSALHSLSEETYRSTGFTPPDIAVQAGAGWQPGDNEAIIDALSDSAKFAIDAVVVHYYPNTLENIGNFGRHLDQIDAWRADPDMSDVRYYATEWNIQNSPQSDFGFSQANSFVHAFEEMLLRGVDSAHVWGSQYRALDTRLSTLSTRDTGDQPAGSINTDLTATGEMFAAMRQSLVGTRSLDMDMDDILSSNSHGALSARFENSFATFGSDDRFVAFGANRNDAGAMRFTADLQSYFVSAVLPPPSC